MEVWLKCPVTRRVESLTPQYGEISRDRVTQRVFRVDLDLERLTLTPIQCPICGDEFAVRTVPPGVMTERRRKRTGLLAGIAGLALAGSAALLVGVDGAQVAAVIGIAVGAGTALLAARHYSSIVAIETVWNGDWPRCMAPR